jgi:hypothetical protein
MPNPWDSVPPPPEHAPPVAVQTNPIPAHRQVRSLVDSMVPVAWAPDSPGAASRTPAPFIRSTLRVGQICDVLSDLVKEHPTWFVWPRATSCLRTSSAWRSSKGSSGRRPDRQVIEGRECSGRRLTGQRLTGAHALKMAPPHRSHALRLSLPVNPLSIGRSARLAGAADLPVPAHGWRTRPEEDQRSGREHTTPASLGRKEESGGQGRVPGERRVGTRGRWYPGSRDPTTQPWPHSLLRQGYASSVVSERVDDVER